MIWEIKKEVRTNATRHNTKIGDIVLIEDFRAMIDKQGWWNERWKNGFGERKNRGFVLVCPYNNPMRAGGKKYYRAFKIKIIQHFLTI